MEDLKPARQTATRPGLRPDALTRAWIALVALSGASALVAALAGVQIDRRLAGAVVLALALVKSRLILSRYLGLWRAPSWRRGFNLTLTLFGLLLLALYLVPGVTS
ncbi:MAG: cytochrome C oxidase subunit IV family protein [Antarcticimicrobium sp.]|uniref:cytochrome C oxidase subunit IV family protein n=1 Tax=Antarcticimicrobium sp. TaxID=2824147 RepID=UPI00263A2A99|nr:cytochrome C oxidase subunit IV family protein [Antarcticimicrobium sp.]MDF1718853.1 cytochrome C oxidase subunit IV family protein [Antarcticimicrobium sp.]